MRKIVFGLLAALLFGAASAQMAAEDIKVGFIYVGPVGDAGWTYAHDLGRAQLEEELGVETVIVESVPESDVEPFIDQVSSRRCQHYFHDLVWIRGRQPLPPPSATRTCYSVTRRVTSARLT